MDGEDDERQRQKGGKTANQNTALKLSAVHHISAIASVGPVKPPAVSSD